MSGVEISHRRTGVGLEISANLVRGIVIDEGHERVVAVHEIPIDRLDDDDVVFDALARLHHQLDAGGRPTRIGWFPTGATLQRIEATGRSGPDLNLLRHELDTKHDINSTMLVDVGARRWLIAVAWNDRAAHRLQTLAERAGFVDATAEPAPISLHRVLGDDVTIVRRDADGTSSWALLRDREAPLAATSLPAGRREYPSLSTATDERAPRIGITDQPTLVADIATATGAAFDERATMSELELALRMLDEPYPPFPAHDLRAPQRVAVALGAALGAAGHHGLLRPVDTMASTRPDIEVERRPWTLERLVDDLDEEIRSTPSWWQRLLIRARAIGR